MTKSEPNTTLPDEVVYFNEWTDFESKDMRALFSYIDHEMLATLKVGAAVWIDSEQPSGKVYGFYRAEITEIEIALGHTDIKFEGPGGSGGQRISKDGGWHKVHRCADDAKLMELVAACPLATETGTVLRMSDASRAYLASIGKVVVPTSLP